MTEQTPSEIAHLPSVQVLYLLDVVRNGIKAPNLRLPFIVTLFIAKAALQILKPGTPIDPAEGKRQNKVVRVRSTGFFAVQCPASRIAARGRGIVHLKAL